MKNSFISSILALTLCLGLAVPAFAAEETAVESLAGQETVPAFSDVSEDAWYAPYVNYLAEQGVMVGNGDGTFSPENILSDSECLTLAYRLYDRIRGQTNIIQEAPSDWGFIILEVGDRAFMSYGDDREFWSWGAWRHGESGKLVLNLRYPELEAWGQEEVGTGAPATVTVSGATYEGTVDCWMPGGSYVLTFDPAPDVAAEATIALHRAIYAQPSPDYWWRDICYTIEQRKLDGIIHPADFGNTDATRGFFASAIHAAAGAFLEKLNEVLSIPDIPSAGESDLFGLGAIREQVYALYEAGILNGVDGTGSFAAFRPLTRAETAAMIARILDPSLRIVVVSGAEDPAE